MKKCRTGFATMTLVLKLLVQKHVESQVVTSVCADVSCQFVGACKSFTTADPLAQKWSFTYNSNQHHIAHNEY